MSDTHIVNISTFLSMFFHMLTQTIFTEEKGSEFWSDIILQLGL